MNEINTGGSAFPLPLSEHLGWRDSEHHGMTLRDYFAAKAMQALLSHPDSRTDIGPEAYAMSAYKMADAMLTARQSL
jgi:hypothetical protein